MRVTIYLFCVIFWLAGINTTQSQLLEAVKGTLSDKIENGKEEKKEKKKSYNDLLKDFETQKGLFKLHTKGTILYFEIPDSLLGREFLLASRVSAISNNREIVAGQMPRQPLLLKFSKDEEKIHVHIVNSSNLCDKNSSTYESLQRNYLNPIMKSFPIKAVSPDTTASVIDVTKFLSSDVKELNPFRKASIIDVLLRKKPLSGTLEVSSSRILSAKAFPFNLNVRSRLAYIAEDAPFVAEMTRSVILLPKDQMKPRISDPRIGFFTERKRVYDENKDEVDYIRYINKWRIEPKEEDIEKYKRGELVEPKKPIVYYVDTAIPEKFRKYIMQGIEDWQPAFEAIGFKNAIVAKEYPKNDPDFDPDDIRYSCYRYVTTPVRNSMGPSWVDPRSGEIITGDVLYYSNITSLIHSWRFVQTANLDPKVRGEVFPTDLMGKSLRYVAAHEIGHTLGLLHNMAASNAFPVDSLRSATFTQKYGTTPSIMDYARYNYVAQPGDKGVKLTPPDLGVYDQYAIKWGYKPIFEAETPEEEYETLNKWILEKADDKMYHYGCQEFFFDKMNPASQSEDLGDNSVKAAEYGVKNLKYTMKHLKEWATTPNRDYSRMKKLYKDIFSQFRRFMGHANGYLGGFYLYEPVAGENRKAGTLVSKKEQQYALDFIFKNLRDIPNWLYNKEVVDCFKPDDLKLGEYTRVMVQHLLDNRITVHLIYNEKINPDTEYSVLDYMDDVYDRVFALTNKGEDLNYFERIIQYSYIKSLLTEGGYISGKKGGKSGFKLNEEEQDYLLLEKMDVNLNELVGSGEEADVKANVQPVYLYELRKAQKLLKKHLNKGDLETKIHYQNLYDQISVFLK